MSGASTTANAQTLRILAHGEHAEADGTRQISLSNDADPHTLKDQLAQIDRIDLHFPAFTDGRAYSQAFLLRRRLGFAGELRATGDVLIDQLVQMQRSGFTVAVLKEGVDASAAQRQFDRFHGFYQGDAIHPEPHFVAEQAAA